MKLLRIASAAALVLLVVAAGVVVAAAAFGGRLLAAGIEWAGPALIGREVRVGGVSVDWGVRTEVAATDFAVANAPWSADAGPLLRARRVEATLDLFDLLRLRVSPVRLALRQPALRLARDERGRWNSPPVGSGGSASPGGGYFEFAAPREVEVEGGEVAVDDLVSPGIEGRIEGLSARGTASGVDFRGTGSYGGGVPLAFSGEAGPLATLYGGGKGGDAKPYPVRLTAGPETARLTADGHLARPLDLGGVDLRVQGQGDDLAPLLAALAVPIAATPPFSLSARLTDAERGWNLRDLSVSLGGSRIDGGASVLLAGRPKPLLKFDASVPRVRPADFGWLTSAGGPSGAPSGAFMDARLPVAWLRRADAEGTVRVERLEGLAAETAELRAGVELKDGRLRLHPLRIELAGGAVEGHATLEALAGEGPPRASLRLEAADGLRLGPLLAAFGAGGVATATVRTASIDLRGQGATPRDVVAGLDGAARFRIADGSLRLPGLAHLSMGLVEAFGAVLGVGGDAGPTPVACAVGDLPVRGGVVYAERLAMVTPRVAITGKGTVRLSDWTLRLTLTPSPIDEALLRVVVPVVVSGELSSPEVSPRPELHVGVGTGALADVCADEAGRR